MQVSSSENPHIHDFDFLFGQWTVSHRRLRERHVGSDDWAEFSGTADTRGLLGGISNIEEHIMDPPGQSGIALRTLDLARNLWSIRWVSSRDGLLQAPVHGGFERGEGRFEGDDLDEGRPVRMRYLWHRITPKSARWEQAFSTDGGGSWETNWIMDFTRTG